MPKLFDTREVKNAQGEIVQEAKQGLFSSIGNVLINTAVGINNPQALLQIEANKKRAEQEAQQQMLIQAITAKLLGIDAQQAQGQLSGRIQAPQTTVGARGIGFGGGLNAQQLSGGTSLTSPEDSMRSFVGSGIPGANLDVTSGKIAGATISQTNKSKLEQGIVADVAKQEEKEKAKKQRGKGEAVFNQSLFMTRLGESFDEVKNSSFSASTEASVEGAVTRSFASMVAKAGAGLPKTGAFLADVLVLANQQARNVEGGRVTDADRQIYAEAMASVVGSPTEGNVIRAANQILRLHEKYRDSGGVYNIIEDLSSGNNELTNAVASEVLRLLPDEDLEVLESGKFKRFNKSGKK